MLHGCYNITDTGRIGLLLFVAARKHRRRGSLLCLVNADSRQENQPSAVHWSTMDSSSSHSATPTEGETASGTSTGAAAPPPGTSATAATNELRASLTQLASTDPEFIRRLVQGNPTPGRTDETAAPTRAPQPTDGPATAGEFMWFVFVFFPATSFILAVTIVCLRMVRMGHARMRVACEVQCDFFCHPPRVFYHALRMWSPCLVVNSMFGGCLSRQVACCPVISVPVGPRRWTNRVVCWLDRFLPGPSRLCGASRS